MQINELLLRLDPTDFENLTFDILTYRGFKNVIWRTPGVDGGRDIEADTVVVDASGHTSAFHWYVECKRYTGTVDWPTVREKIAYAENHAADYLLLVLTSTLSPKCVDEVTRWNNSKKKPSIRVWPGNELPNILEALPQVAVRYGLATTLQLPIAMYGLSVHIAKACQAAYSSMRFLGDAGGMLEMSAALAALMSARTESLESSGIVLFQPFSPDRDAYEWWVLDGEAPAACDRSALRAAVCIIRQQAAGVANVKMRSVAPNAWEITIEEAKAYNSISGLLKEVSLWANFMIEGDAPVWRITLKSSKD